METPRKDVHGRRGMGRPAGLQPAPACAIFVEFQETSSRAGNPLVIHHRQLEAHHNLPNYICFSTRPDPWPDVGPVMTLGGCMKPSSCQQYSQANQRVTRYRASSFQAVTPFIPAIWHSSSGTAGSNKGVKCQAGPPFLHMTAEAAAVLALTCSWPTHCRLLCWHW